MIYFYCIALLLACGQVELKKFSLMSAPLAAEPAEYYQPIRQQQQQEQYGYQQQFYAPRPQQLPIYQPYQSPALAYVIVRPIAPSYPYYDNSPRYYAPLQQQQPAAPILADQSGVKGGLAAPEPERGQVKGGFKQDDFKLEQQQPIEPSNQPLYQPPPQPIVEPQPAVYDMGMGKLLKLKSTFDKFAASAKAKLSLGTHSSYYVTGEEIVPPAAPPQPLHQEQLHTGDIQLTKLEQQHIEEAGQTKLEEPALSQVKLEETRQEKLIEQHQEPLRETKGYQQEPLRETKGYQQEPLRETKGYQQEPLRETKGYQQEPLRETKGYQQEPLRETKGYQQEPLRETKGLQQEPLRETKGYQQEPLREVKGLEQQQQPQQQQQQLPLQQERYPEKGLEQRPTTSYQQQQQKEEFQQPQAPIKSEHRDQVRFNGQQQPSSYYTGSLDSDGFGKRVSAN